MTNGEVEVEEVERKQEVEEVQELHLTDDLADSLMNPPTEPEQSDEEPTNLCSTHVVEMKTEQEEEVLLEEDQEVQGITEAVEELAKNNSLSEEVVEVVTVREKSPQIASRSLPAEVSMKVSPMPETLVMEQEQEHCEKTENATSSSLPAADLVEKEKEEEVAVQETLMEVDNTVKEEEKEEEVAQTTVGDNETVGEALKGNNKQQGTRGPRNKREQGGKRTWEKERKKEKKVEMEKVKVAAAGKCEEQTAKTTMSLTELPKKSYRRPPPPPLPPIPLPFS